MAKLDEERCVACLPGSPTVTEAELAELTPLVPDWQIVDDGEPTLSRRFAFPDFAGALAFADEVGAEAEREEHHPEITVGWGSATVRWWTHAIGGLHRNDFIMATKTDAIHQRSGG